ncbi:MAG: hypothetical protein GF404_08875 [candidate division Zixibacteria bacterium]|nr:hypothetical protein [candidate division Zixibacteria bacterium]
MYANKMVNSFTFTTAVVFVIILLSSSSILTEGDASEVIFEQASSNQRVSAVTVSTFEVEQADLSESDIPEDLPATLYHDRQAIARLKEQANRGQLSSEGELTVDVSSGSDRDRTLVNEYPGFSYTGWFPPDPVLAAGKEHLVCCVNSAFAIYDKENGDLLFSTTFASWFSNVSPPGKIFDPKVIYDNHEERWVILAVSRNNTTEEASYMITISDDDNPLGTWYLYNLDATLNGSTPTDTWADFPGLAHDYEGAIYITSNQYEFGGSFQYSRLRLLKKSEIYFGISATWHDFWSMKNSDGSTAFSVKPAEVMSSPVGNWLVNTDAGGGDFITVWRLINPLSATPSLSRQGDVASGTYTIPPDAEQPDGYPDINTNDCRALEVIYRFGNLYFAFTAGLDWGGGNVRAGLKYYRVNSATLDVEHQRNFGHPDFDYYYPKVTPSRNGQCVTMVFNRSGVSEYAGIRYVLDFENNNSSALLKAGEGPYENVYNGRNRWGDYNGIWVDPEDYSMWMHAEYATTTDYKWATWIGSVTCDPPASITNVQFTPESPYSLNNGDNVNISFDYFNPRTDTVMIFGRPYTDGQLTPGYGASGSAYFTYGFGSGSDFFTIMSGETEVDSFRYVMRSKDYTDTLIDMFIPVNYYFGYENEIKNVTLNPPSPSNMSFYEPVEITVDAEINTTNGAVIHAWLLADGSGRAHDKTALEIPGGTVTLAPAVSGGTTYIDSIFIYISENVTSNTLVSMYIPVEYNYEYLPANRDLVYIYEEDTAQANDYATLLTMVGEFNVDVVSAGDVLATDLTAYDAIVLGRDLNSSVDSLLAAEIDQAHRPVIGMSYGGGRVFDEMLSTDHVTSLNSMGIHGNANVVLYQQDHELYEHPYYLKSFIPADSIVKIDNYIGNRNIYVPEPQLDLNLFGRNTESGLHYLMAQEDTKYFFWGSSSSMDSLTQWGQFLLVNTINYMLTQKPICGDNNHDGEINVSDVIHEVNYIFLGGHCPHPFEVGDCNCDGMVNVSDAFYIVNYIFQDGTRPCDTDGDGTPDC